MNPNIVPLCAGLGMGASMIVAIGPQNAYLIRQGVNRDSAYLVALIYIVIDALLITLGTVGVTKAASQLPVVENGLGVAATGLLVYLAFRHFKSALGRTSHHETSVDAVKSRKSTVVTSLGVSILNPAVLFDTVILIGGIASQYGDDKDKLLFATGALLFSCLWFIGLATFSVGMARLFRNPRAFRLVDAVLGVLMLGLAGSIAHGLLVR